MGRSQVGIDGLTVYEIKGFVPDKLNCFKMEENGRKPTLLSGGDMLAHDLRTVKEHCPFKMQFWVTNTTQFEKKA